MEPRDVDARICEAVRAQKRRPDGIPSAELAQTVGVSRDYLRARLRFMERTGLLPHDVARKLPERQTPVPDERIERAWQEEATTTAVAKAVGLSRAGVLQRVARLRAAGVELHGRPHGALTPEQQLEEIKRRIRQERPDSGRQEESNPERPGEASASPGDAT